MPRACPNKFKPDRQSGQSKSTKIIENSAREIILRVRDFCEAEKAHGHPIIPFQQLRYRVAAMTGVSEKTVTRICKQRERDDKNAESKSPITRKSYLKMAKDIKIQKGKTEHTKEVITEIVNEINGPMVESMSDSHLLSIEYTKEEYLDEEYLEEEDESPR